MDFYGTQCYKISNMGRLKSYLQNKKVGEILDPQEPRESSNTKQLIFKVKGITNGKRQQDFPVIQAVAEHFLQNSKPKDVNDAKAVPLDKNWMNIQSTNLRWVTPQVAKSYSIPNIGCVLLNETGNIINYYPNQTVAKSFHPKLFNRESKIRDPTGLLRLEGTVECSVLYKFKQSVAWKSDSILGY